MPVRQRPGFTTNVERTSKTTQKKSIFWDIKPGQSVNLRFTPPSDESGELFFRSAQHYKLKDEGQPRAYACLRLHGTTDCPVCVFLEKADVVLASNETLLEKLHRDHDVSYRWHAQIVPVLSGDLSDQTFVVGLSKVTADKVSKILKMEQDNRQILLTDPDQGQAINISRNEKTGFGTRYEVLPTGLRVSLDDITTKNAAGLPAWEENFLVVKEAIRLRVEAESKLYKSLAETVGVGVFGKVLPDVEF